MVDRNLGIDFDNFGTKYIAICRVAAEMLRLQSDNRIYWVFDAGNVEMF